jgi:hypothetical protein
LDNAKLGNLGEVSAIIYDKYAQGSKDIVENNKRGQAARVNGGDISLLNQRSISDLQKIKKILQEQELKINDLQFLIANDGSVVIADPLKLEYKKNASKSDQKKLIFPSDNNLRTINELIKAAMENI